MNRVVGAVAPLGARSLSTSGQAYKAIFKRNTTYISYVVGGAIVLQYVFVSATDSLWASWNKGVSLACPPSISCILNFYDFYLVFCPVSSPLVSLRKRLRVWTGPSSRRSEPGLPPCREIACV